MKIKQRSFYLSRMEDMWWRSWIIFFCAASSSVYSILQGSSFGMRFRIMYFKPDLLKSFQRKIAKTGRRASMLQNARSNQQIQLPSSLPKASRADTCLECPFWKACVDHQQVHNRLEAFSFRTLFSESPQIFAFSFVFFLPYTLPLHIL